MTTAWLIKALTLLVVFPLLAACGPEEEKIPSAASPAGPAEAASGPDPAAAVLATPPPSAPEAAIVLEESDWSEVVARVNGEPITRRLLASQAALAAATPLDEEEGAPAARAAALETEQLRNLIILALACQEALRLGYAPSGEELDQALAAYKDDFAEPEQVYQVLDQYGSTEEDLKQQLRRNMALKRWQASEFLSEIKVGEDEARAFYQAHLDQLRHGERLRLSQILVGVSLLAAPAVKDQARGRAEAALRRLAAGEDFGAVAAEVNADPEAAENRGDLGWFARGQSLPAIEVAVWDLPVGGRTGLVETIQGFHLLEVTGRRPPGVESFENLRPELVEFISARKLEEVLDRRMRDLILAADIEILDEALQGARPGPGPERTSSP